MAKNQRAHQPPQLTDVDPASTGGFKHKDQIEDQTRALQKELYDQLYLMFAEAKHSLLVILQGIDTSGKDGTIRHIFDSANPQGVRVYSFKKPSEEELRHDYLWRCHKAMPEAGYASIFNRSYYEEVTTVRVHPEYLRAQNLPNHILEDPNIFKKRFNQINEFEKMLTENGVQIVKFLLHISKGEQKVRLTDRIDDRTKNWKSSPQDLIERKHWDEYMKAFQDMVKHTHSAHAPWHIVPADKKWYRNYEVSRVLVDHLSGLKMTFPKL